jgi:RNA polymerase sigma-70 factor (ECF subfamily)
MKRNWKIFENYYREFVRPVYRYIAVRVKDQAEAEDLVSEIFLKTLEHFDDFDQTRPFSHWIFTIAHNHLIGYFRKHHPTVRLEDIAELQNPYDLEKEAGDHQDFEQVTAGLSLMSPEKKQMVEMKYILGYSYKEIGEVLGKTEDNVKVSTFRAIEELRTKNRE